MAVQHDEAAVRPSLTPAGSAVAIGAAVLVLVGWSFGYVALTIIAAGAFAALVAGAFAARSMPQLDVHRAIEPARVERGSRAFGLVSVRNRDRRQSRACTAVDVIATRRVAGASSAASADSPTVQVDIPPLRAGRSVAVPYEVPTHRRGALVIGPLTITRRDPLALWRARRPVGDAVTLLVQPHIHPIDPRRGGRARHIEGPVSDTASNGVLTFHSLREYTPGDDVRRIHWKSSARTGTLMVREHVDTSLPSAVVVFDTRADRYSAEAFEEAVDVVASVIAASQARGFPVRAVSTGGASFIVRAGQRGQELHDYLTTVEPSEPGNAGSLPACTVEVLRGREHDAITVIAGEIDATDLAAVTTMTRGFASSALVTVRSHSVTWSTPGDPARGLAGAPRLRWTSGAHLDGATAAEALVPWRTAAAAARTSAPTNWPVAR